MSVYRRWMLVILVAFAQLVAFLAVHLWMADRTLHDHTKLLVEKTESENRIVSDAALYRLLRLDRDGMNDISRIKTQLTGVTRPENCGLAVIDERSGQTIIDLNRLPVLMTMTILRPAVRGTGPPPNFRVKTRPATAP